MKKVKAHQKSCSPKCWFAKRDKCTCICYGANHKLGERASKTLLKSMEMNYGGYKKARRTERKMARKGIPLKRLAGSILSGSFMKDILRLGKQVKRH